MCDIYLNLILKSYYVCLDVTLKDNSQTSTPAVFSDGRNILETTSTKAPHCHQITLSITQDFYCPPCKTLPVNSQQSFMSALFCASLTCSLWVIHQTPA